MVEPDYSKIPGAERLLRLWGLLEYLGEHSEVPLAELAEVFGVKPSQVRADLRSLAKVETPGQVGFYLIDLDLDALDDDEVRLTIADDITIPSQLNDDEIIPIVASLRALVESEFLAAQPDRAAVVASALAKLEAVAGPRARALDVRLPATPNTGVAVTISNAITNGHRLALDYINSDHTVTRREADPVVVITQDRHTYLRAWCHFRAEPRVFRLDRILSAVELPEPVDAKLVAAVTRASDIASETAQAGTLDAVLTLAPAARWMAEELPGEVTELPDGQFNLRLRVASPKWLESLLLAVAPHVIAVDPPELAARVSKSAKAALANYSR